MTTCSGLARLFALCLGVLALSGGARAGARLSDASRSTSSSASRPAAPTTSPRACSASTCRNSSASSSSSRTGPAPAATSAWQASLASPPDGYTIVFVGPNNFINASLYEQAAVRFHPRQRAGRRHHEDDQRAGGEPDVPIKTVAEFIAYAKANPGKLNFGSGGVGTSPHMSGELLKSMTGINIVHVPYRGTAPALTDLLGGQLQSVFDNLPGSIGHIKTGKLRALGVDRAKRVAALPDVPTIAETVPGYEASCLFTASRCRRARRPRSSPSSTRRSTRC